MLMAKSRTTEFAVASCFSDPMPKNFFAFPWNQRNASLGSDVRHIIKSSCEFRKWEEKAIEKQDRNQKQPFICYLKIELKEIQ